MNEKDKHPGGRPAYFDAPEEFEAEVVKYFNQFTKSAIEDGIIPENGEHRPTITGMCLFLGFESRQSFYDYAKRDEFSYVIKKARLRIEHVYENMLDSKAVTGAIFALKQFDWTDRQEIDHTTQGDKIAPFVLNVKPDKE